MRGNGRDGEDGKVCRFGCPHTLHRTTKVAFIEAKDGGVQVNITGRRNDPRLVSHNPAQLFLWGGNCDMQIILDEEQAIRYMVKYATKPEGRSENATDMIKAVLAKRGGGDNNDEEKEASGGAVAARVLEDEDRPAQRQIRQLMLRAVGERDRGMLSEHMYHSDFVDVPVNLNSYNTRKLKPEMRYTLPLALLHLLHIIQPPLL